MKKKLLFVCILLAIAILYKVNFDWNYQLVIAIEKGDYSKAEIMLKKTPIYDLNVVPSDSIPFYIASLPSERTALQEACNRGNLDLVSLMINNGAWINFKGILGHATPLECAIRGEKSNKYEIVKYLVEHGANVNRKAWSDHYPIEWAAILSPAIEKKDEYYYDRQQAVANAKIVEYLWPYATKLTSKEMSKGDSLLFYATYSDNDAVVKYLVTKGLANENAQDENGRTAIYYHSIDEYDHNYPTEEIIEFLVQQGIDLFHKDKNGQTAYEYALSENEKEYAAMIKKLMDEQIGL